MADNIHNVLLTSNELQEFNTLLSAMPYVYAKPLVDLLNGAIARNIQQMQQLTEQPEQQQWAEPKSKTKPRSRRAK